MRIFISIVFFALCFIGIHHTEVRKEVEIQIGGQAQVMADQIGAAFADAELLSKALVKSLDDGAWHKLSKVQLHATLGQNISYAAKLRHTLLFDATGTQQAGSFHVDVPNIHVDDRPYFKKLVAGENYVLFGPYVGRNTGYASYAIIRALHSNGKFDGFLMVVLSVEHLNQICTRSVLSNSNAFLIESNGKIIGGCNVDSNALGSGQSVYSFLRTLTHLENLPIDFDSLASGFTAIGDYLLATRPVFDQPSLRVVVAANLRNEYNELFKHLLSEFIVFLISLLIVVLPVKTYNCKI